MALNLPKRTRIVLLFLVGIALPSLLLGYLAFRGVQNDRALLEKNRANEHRGLAEKVSQSLDGRLRAAEQAFQEFLLKRDSDNRSEMIVQFDNLKTKNPLIGEVLTILSSRQIRFFETPLLFHSSGSIPSPGLSSPDSSVVRLLQQGEQMEFQKKDYQKALALYRQALRRTSDHHTCGDVLSKIARVQKKAKLFQDTMNTYQTLGADYSRVQITEGIPLGLAARLEMGVLLVEIEDFAKAWDVFTQLYQDLINGEWMLEKEPFNFYSTRIRDSIFGLLSEGIPPEQLQSHESQFQELMDKENIKREGTERLLLFQVNAFTEWEHEALPFGEDITEGKQRLTVEIGTNEYLVSLLRNNSTGEEIWGLLIDSSYLKNSFLPNVIQLSISSEDTDWIIRGRNRELILASANPPTGSLTVKSDFIGNFPNWTMEFYQADPRFLEDFLVSRRGIYFYMFILIAGILVFGLILTIRSFTREMELSRMKSDFVSTVSHEFKSPLTSIRQIAEMLHAGRVPSEERRQKYYDVLLEQSERLSLLTENVLSFAKMEEGKREFVFEQADIKALLMKIVSTIQDQVRHDGFEIEAEIENFLPPIRADVSALTQAITNLIDNAVKYSGDSKKVFVKAQVDEQHLVISVRDYGVGIKKEELNKIFDRFYRGGDELTRTVKGSGLGLTLVKQIVEAHKGSIQVDSELGKGSVFSMKFPIDPNKG
jgi:signal transduction histidine kinase/tetratricopeptide (TPR) repeat protein